MVISTNTTAQMSADNLQSSQTQMSQSIARLSSGSKIVNPSDDAGGLAMANRLDAQIKRLDAAKADVGNAISFTQTQDGYLKGVTKAISRMSELSLLAQDVTKGTSDRAAYGVEFSQLQSFIADAAQKTFNGINLFDTANDLAVPLDSEGLLLLTMGHLDLNGDVYSNISGLTIDTASNAQTALGELKTLTTTVSQYRATIGAYQSRLNYSTDQLVVSKENITAASSRIQDADVAEESTTLARANVLQQAGTAMLAQANQMPQSVLKLLQG